MTGNMSEPEHTTLAEREHNDLDLNVEPDPDLDLTVEPDPDLDLNPNSDRSRT